MASAFLMDWSTNQDDISYILNKSNSKHKWSPKPESRLVENATPFLFQCCLHSVFLPVVKKALVSERTGARHSGGQAGCGMGGGEAVAGGHVQHWAAWRGGTPAPPVLCLGSPLLTLLPVCTRPEILICSCPCNVLKLRWEEGVGIIAAWRR